MNNFKKSSTAVIQLYFKNIMAKQVASSDYLACCHPLTADCAHSKSMPRYLVIFVTHPPPSYSSTLPECVFQLQQAEF